MEQKALTELSQKAWCSTDMVNLLSKISKPDTVCCSEDMWSRRCQVLMEDKPEAMEGAAEKESCTSNAMLSLISRVLMEDEQVSTPCSNDMVNLVSQFSRPEKECYSEDMRKYASQVFIAEKDFDLNDMHYCSAHSLMEEEQEATSESAEKGYGSNDTTDRIIRVPTAERNSYLHDMFSYISHVSVAEKSCYTDAMLNHVSHVLMEKGAFKEKTRFLSEGSRYKGRDKLRAIPSSHSPSSVSTRDFNLFESRSSSPLPCCLGGSFESSSLIPAQQSPQSSEALLNDFLTLHEGVVDSTVKNVDQSFRSISKDAISYMSLDEVLRQDDLSASSIFNNDRVVRADSQNESSGVLLNESLTRDKMPSFSSVNNDEVFRIDINAEASELLHNQLSSENQVSADLAVNKKQALRADSEGQLPAAAQRSNKSKRHQKDDPASDSQRPKRFGVLAVADLSTDTPSNEESLSSIAVHRDPANEWGLSNISRNLNVTVLRPAARGQNGAVELSYIGSESLIPTVIECAKLVSANDVRAAQSLVNEIRRKSSPFGFWKQRLAHYFVEALAARLGGNGSSLYTSLTKGSLSVAEMIRAYQICMTRTPCLRIPYMYANLSIMDACDGESKLHIVDLGFRYGIQWFSLIEALAKRRGGPPRLRITLVDSPLPGANPARRSEETGRRLAEHAHLHGVSFEFQALAIKWDEFSISSLKLRHTEVLVVNCMLGFRHLMDETMKVESQRKILLEKIRSMNPKILVQGDSSTGINSPFGFMHRFHECLAYYTTKFEAVDASIPNPERLLMDRNILGPVIVNVLACEGVERVERPEGHPRLKALTERAGFTIMPLNIRNYNKTKDMLGCYHKNYSLSTDGGWVLLGWKGYPTNNVCVWHP